MSPQKNRQFEQQLVGEQSPLLLLYSDSTALGEETSQPSGTATFSETTINSAKICIGSGTLALPFAVNQGGWVLHVLGTIGISSWTVYSIDRLLRCTELLPRSTSKNSQSPEGTAALGRVAFYSLGYGGLHFLDAITVLLEIGVIVAYIDAICSFLGNTPVTTGSSNWNAFSTAVVIGILSNVPDMGYLSKLSAISLTTLFLTLVVIGCYGDFSSISLNSLNVWPQNGLSGVSRWFGCNVFGYGTIPFTYNLRDSMAQPQRMLPSSIASTLSVGTSYILIGVGLLLLYPDVKGDILQQLPVFGIVPSVIRLAMALVVITTAPLIVVPCGELIEGKLFGGQVTTAIRVCVRLAICILCTSVSILVPSFVDILSLVGCCCVALVSFVVPPMLHIFLLLQHGLHMDKLPTTKDSMDEAGCIRTIPRRTMLVDVVMMTWGVVATVISTTYVFRVANHTSR